MIKLSDADVTTDDRIMLMPSGLLQGLAKSSVLGPVWQTFVFRLGLQVMQADVSRGDEHQYWPVNSVTGREGGGLHSLTMVSQFYAGQFETFDRDNEHLSSH